jgi:hypothetical protein
VFKNFLVLTLSISLSFSSLANVNEQTNSPQVSTAVENKSSWFSGWKPWAIGVAAYFGLNRFFTHVENKNKAIRRQRDFRLTQRPPSDGRPPFGPDGAPQRFHMDPRSGFSSVVAFGAFGRPSVVGGAFTSEMRYPQMLRHLQQILRERQGDLRALVMGPGLAERLSRRFNPILSVPQLHELMAFFRQHSVTVVDHNPAVLAAIPESSYNEENAAGMIANERNFGAEARAYQDVLNQVRQEARRPIGDVQRHQGDFRDFNFNVGSFDFIFATLSLVYAVNELAQQDTDGAQDLLVNVLSWLSVGGILYADD